MNPIQIGSAFIFYHHLLFIIIYIVYYLYSMIFDSKKANFSRDEFVNRMINEGAPISTYCRPIYRMPLFKFKNGDKVSIEKLAVVFPGPALPVKSVQALLRVNSLTASSTPELGV